MMKHYLEVLSVLTVLSISCSPTENNIPEQPYVDPSEEVIPDVPVVQENDGDYRIVDGKISYKVLRNYLSRAITEAEYLNSAKVNCDRYYGTDDDRRMLLNTGAKFIGRAMYMWNGEQKFNNSSWFETARKKIQDIHAKDPDVIFQAALFETVSRKGIEQVQVPSWVFKAFGKEPESRNFRFDDIMDENGVNRDHWGIGTCVPDMSREEAQMWFYYMAVRYMEIGIEALHMGQVNLMCSMGDQQAGYAGWRKMQGLIREAAKTKARRGIVLMDAHCTGIVVDGQHLFDFASYPLRLKEVPSSSTMEATLEAGYIDNMIGKTLAGTTPSGWYASRLPYILEFDNYGTSDHPGKSQDDWYIWGYDEISWIGMVPEEYAQRFVRECMDYMRRTDPVGYIQMPGCRIAAAINQYGSNPYRCNTNGNGCPTGRNLENTIKSLWR